MLIFYNNFVYIKSLFINIQICCPKKIILKISQITFSKKSLKIQTILFHFIDPNISTAGLLLFLFYAPFICNIFFFERYFLALGFFLQIALIFRFSGLLCFIFRLFFNILDDWQLVLLFYVTDDKVYDCVKQVFDVFASFCWNLKVGSPISWSLLLGLFFRHAFLL